MKPETAVPFDRDIFLEEVRRQCRDEEMLPAGPMLLMVSGGQDSITLLHLFSGALWETTEGTHSGGTAGGLLPRPGHVVCLHINHHLRGEDSAADQRLVERACAELGVELLIEDCPIDKAAGNVQEAARDARRAAAVRAAARTAAAAIATGHTQDDQVETMLYRLGRYGGPASLRAIKPVDGVWIRPLLSVRRRDTERYCRELGLPFAVDRGNEYPGYARTGIRNSVVPAWEEAVPGAVEAAGRAAGLTGRMMVVVDARVEEALGAASVGAVGGGAEEFSARRLLSLGGELRRLALHRLLEAHEGTEVSRARVLAMEAMLAGPSAGRLSLSGGWVMEKEYDRVRIVAGAAPVTPQASAAGSAGTGPLAPVEFAVPGTGVWGGLILSAEACSITSARRRTEAYVDAACLSETLEVRAWLPGDRVRPLGAAGSRKLQDVFTDARVPASARVRVPLFLSRGRIVWVGGICLSEESKISRGTEAVVRLAIRRESGTNT